MKIQAYRDGLKAGYARAWSGKAAERHEKELAPCYVGTPAWLLGWNTGFLRAIEEGDKLERDATTQED